MSVMPTVSISVGPTAGILRRTRNSGLVTSPHSRAGVFNDALLVLSLLFAVFHVLLFLYILMVTLPSTIGKNARNMFEALCDLHHIMLLSCLMSKQGSVC